MNNRRKHPKTRAAEREHHDSYDESLESKLCKLHIKTLSFGQLPKSYTNAYTKSGYRGEHAHKLSQEELDQVVLLNEYMDQFGVPATSKNGQPIKWFTHWQKRILLAFCEFIDSPAKCHKGQLSKLHHCKSRLKSLQHKQRVTLVEVVTTLFTCLDVESLRVGQYAKDDDSRLFDEQGNELMRGVTHGEVRSLYHRLWKKPISKTKYHDTLNMLKLAGFFDVEACYLANEEAELKRAELRKAGATEDEIASIPSIYSEAAYKWFDVSFIEAFGIADKEDMIQSRERCIKTRIKKKLSSIFATYKPVSDSFWTKKRKEFLNRFGAPRYPQGANVMRHHSNQSEFWDSAPPELIPLRH